MLPPVNYPLLCIKQPGLAEMYFEEVRGTVNDPRIDIAEKLIRRMIGEKREETLLLLRAEIKKMLRENRTNNFKD